MAERLERAQLDAIARDMDQRFTALHEQLDWRRQHYNNDSAVDPALGEQSGDGEKLDNPFKDVPPYQSDDLRRLMQELVARVAENEVTFTATAPRESSSLKAIADDISSVFNSWYNSAKLRLGYDPQEVLCYGQGRDCYGILHTRRAEEVWPDIEYEWTNELPDDEDEAKRYGPYDGEDAQGAYRETAGSYTQRRDRTYAQAGSPWLVECVHARFVSWIKDRHPAGGLGALLLTYEVPVLEYGEARERAAGKKPSALDAHPLGLGDEMPAPDIRMPGQSGLTTWSPSGDDHQRRVKVRQLWTRECWYEWVDTAETGDAAWNAKVARYATNSEECLYGEHDYGCVPFWIVASNYNHDMDARWAYEPYLEGVYRQKPFYDRLKTLVGGMAELTARPLLVYQQRKGELPQLLEDGTPVTGKTDTIGSGTLPAGQDIVPVYMQVSAALPQFYASFAEDQKTSWPSTGQAELTATSAPWLARISTQQANAGPKALVKQQNEAFQWMATLWLRWHQAHPDEKLISFPLREDKRPDRTKVIVVDGSQLKGFDVEASINPVSSLEAVTFAEHMMGFLLQGLITEEDFQKARGERSPHDYILNKKADKAADPWISQIVVQELARIMGPRVVMGPDGQMINMQGQPVPPEQVLAQNGYQLPQQQPAPNAPQMGGAGAAMPPLPGQPAIPGAAPAAMGLSG